LPEISKGLGASRRVAEIKEPMASCCGSVAAVKVTNDKVATKIYVLPEVELP